MPTVQVLFDRRGVGGHVWIVHAARRPSSSHRLVGGAACADGRSVGLGVRFSAPRTSVGRLAILGGARRFVNEECSVRIPYVIGPCRPRTSGPTSTH